MRYAHNRLPSIVSTLSKYIKPQVLVSLVISLALTSNIGALAADNSGMHLVGVNISGGEFDPWAVPGKYGTNYIYPNAKELDYFKSKGMNIIRVAFTWERMQQSVNGPLDPTELARYDAVVNAITSRGMYTIVDPHNFGKYQKKLIGVAGGQPNSMFADFWSKMAAHYKNNPYVIFGLMTEPVGKGMTSTTWLASSQAAINAIRATGATNLILVPGAYWGSASEWVQKNASQMIKITDPMNNFAFDVHQYFDYDGSGTHTDCLSPADTVATLSGFTNWLKANNRTAFLSEFGMTGDAGPCASEDALLRYMYANPRQWCGYTWWMAGRWYDPTDLYMIEQLNGQDRPQMQVMVNNMNAAH